MNNNNPMNDSEIRVGFLKLGYTETDIREMYLMFENIRKIGGIAG